MYEIINHVTKISTDIEPATSLLKDVLTWGEKKFIERRNKTIEKFYIQLLDGEVTQEKIEYEKEHIEVNSEQYYILLNLAINDEEQEKDFIYANVYKYIRDHQTLERKDKIKLIKIVKQLPYSALEILPHIYIHANFTVVGKSLKQLLKDMELTHEYELNLLTQFNILFKPNNSNSSFPKKFIGIFDVKDAKNFNSLCMAFFSEKNLNPSIYDLNIWKEKKVLILTHDVFNEDPFGNKIKEILNSLYIQSEILNYKSATVTGYSHIIFLTDQSEINANFDDLSEKFKLRPLNIPCQSNSDRRNPITPI